MKRPVRVPSQFSDSMHQRLSSYVLAATGMSLLASAHPTEARIVYTPANTRIQSGYGLDLNHDGVNDFIFHSSIFASGGTLQVRPHHKSKNQVWGTNRLASALYAGVTVHSSKKLQVSNTFMCLSSTLKSFGFWQKVQNRYLGLKFHIRGKTHYGWARLAVSSCILATLTGYAYETIPDKPIITGKTHGKDEATLRRLAQGASGRAAWRGKN